VSPPKRPGRPPLDTAGSSVAVTLRIPSKDYDRVFIEAHRGRVTVSELLRRKLRLAADEDFRTRK
jgi:hypothetical protein